jgi:hypothetical protein
MSTTDKGDPQPQAFGVIDQTLFPFEPDGPSSRAALVAEWMTLVRTILPGMSEGHQWPVTQDHCFMRICLDIALGAPWHTVIKRPAIRHLSDRQLSAAIAVAKGFVHNPETLHALNQRSIGLRCAIQTKRL